MSSQNSRLPLIYLLSLLLLFWWTSSMASFIAFFIRESNSVLFREYSAGVLVFLKSTPIRFPSIWITAMFPVLVLSSSKMPEISSVVLGRSYPRYNSSVPSILNFFSLPFLIFLAQTGHIFFSPTLVSAFLSLHSSQSSSLRMESLESPCSGSDFFISDFFTSFSMHLLKSEEISFRLNSSVTTMGRVPDSGHMSIFSTSFSTSERISSAFLGGTKAIRLPPPLYTTDSFETICEITSSARFPASSIMALAPLIVSRLFTEEIKFWIPDMSILRSDILPSNLNSHSLVSIKPPFTVSSFRRTYFLPYPSSYPEISPTSLYPWGGIKYFSPPSSTLWGNMWSSFFSCPVSS